MGSVEGGCLDSRVKISFKPSFLKAEKICSAVCELIAELFQLFFSLYVIGIKREATNGSEVTGPRAVLYLVMAT
eukprot:10385944-Ditylum_brightwellii.AAC.1